MATARDLLTGDVKTEKGQCKRSSAEFEPPYMAEGDRLNLVLFGRSGARKTSAGNAILGQRESSVDSSSSSVCERREGEVCGRLVTVVEMPALCESQLSASTVSRLCASLCGPGVHAFLLVIPAAPLTDEDKVEITRIQEIFGSRVTEYMMVLFTHESPSVQPVHDFLQQNNDTQELLEICSNRYCVFNNQDIVKNPVIPELLEAIEKMNRARESCFSLYMCLEARLEKVQGLKARYKTELEEKDRIIRKLQQNIKGKSLGRNLKQDGRDCVRIVLVGRTGVGKSAAGNTILGREAFTSKTQSSSVTKKCQIETGTILGRQVAVIDTPGLYDTTLSTEGSLQEIIECMGLASPGPHVFLLVMSVGRFTPEEGETLRLIKMTFGDKAEKYTMVLFTRGDDLDHDSIEEYIANGHCEVKNLIENCGGRYHVLNNREKRDKSQVTNLLKKIEKMNRMNEGSCYTHEMFLEAEKIMMRIRMVEREELKRELAKSKSEAEALKREKQEMGRMLELLREKEGENQARAEREEEPKRIEHSEFMVRKLDVSEERLKNEMTHSEEAEKQKAEEFKSFRTKYPDRFEPLLKKKRCVIL